MKWKLFHSYDPMAAYPAGALVNIPGRGWCYQRRDSTWHAVGAKPDSQLDRVPLDGLPGPMGPPGRDGKDGARGPRGEKGERGYSIVGPRGPRGLSAEGTAGSSETIYATFEESTQSGMVVCPGTAGGVGLALASVNGNPAPMGVCAVGVGAGGNSTYLADGILSGIDWTFAAGTPTLDPGAIYYLSSTTPGCITKTAPTQEGDFVVVIGRGTPTGGMAIELSVPVKL